MAKDPKPGPKAPEAQPPAESAAAAAPAPAPAPVAKDAPKVPPRTMTISVEFHSLGEGRAYYGLNAETCVLHKDGDVVTIWVEDFNPKRHKKLEKPAPSK